MTTAHEFTIVGKSVPVKDGREKVTGTLKYAVDLTTQGMVHGKILRSPHSHARITRIDTARAEALPGVLGVVTHHDSPGLNWESGWFNYRGHILDGTVRFIGDEVAALAATSEEIAEAALALIDVDYEVLPAVFDPEEAMTPRAPVLREEGNVRPASRVEWGDVDKGEAESDFVVECEIRFESQQAAPMGRNACIAEWSGDRVTVWSSSQTPSELRDGVHEAFGIPLSKIRVVALPSGCSFGVWWSCNFMLVTVLLARKVRRPVKIELTNAECMATVKRRHLEVSRGRMGCTKDGNLIFTSFDHVFDNGGYGFKDNVGFSCIDTWGRIRNGRFAIHGVNTNLVTAGCMRGVGDVTLGSCVERLADRLAEKVGMDPVAFRIKNQITPGEELRRTHSRPSRERIEGSVEEYLDRIPEALRKSWPKPFHLSSGSTEKILIAGSEAFGWNEKWKGWREPYAADGPLRRAVGVGTGIHSCGVEIEGGVAAMVRINPDGSAKLFCAAGRQGQGSETTLAQVAAETLGIPFNTIEVETGDTDACPWSHGSLASNTMYRGGFVTRDACLDAKRQLLEIAAREFFEGKTEVLDVVDGLVQYRNEPEKNPRVTIHDVLNQIRSDTLGQTSSITGRSSTPMPPPTTFARHFAAHFADVEVDVETGEIRLLDYLATQDSGTVVNPKVLMNQAIGGAICGAGFAIYESLVFDAETGEVQNAGLQDYKLLRSTDFPAHARVLFGDSYDPVGPYGARGAGEAPIAAAVPAIAQAVYNAIGVWVDVPMTPERVVRALGQLD
ncbi:MAG: xanthine dehydrogenase family protein molybdopterin-binding subunit [Arenicellales bacterium]|nr:xanthine dehydrogenase family protein molybdopterin-binding subunit [Arenicellales bacterium]